MKLKKLEITGFKSFLDRITLDFAGGISAIVGPNGCGKSNVVDAIRWVMGEQRVKMLRGKKMEDVVFNGSEDTPPVGMAEVSMILTKEGQDFPGDYREFNEVMISRRLFRDGESEYAINKIPCRLMDVKEFFMGTGIGARTYSLVEQNSIAGLVEAKPEERRQFIEEAAGVSKYKSRKEVAARKLEATEQNMIRVSDIIREVKTQLSAISRQAKRAEQYKALRKSIKDAEMTLILQNYAELGEHLQEIEKSRETMKDGDLTARTKMQTLEAAWEGIKAQILENDASVSTSQENLYKIKNRIDIREQDIAFTKKKLDDLLLTRQKASQEVENLRTRMVEVEKEHQSLRTTVGDLDAQIRAAGISLAEMEEVLENLKKEDRETYLSLEEKKIQYIDLVTQKANLKNTMASLMRAMEDLRKRRERDDKDSEDQQKKLAVIGESLEKLVAELAADEKLLQNLTTKKDDLLDELARSREELQEIDEEITDVKEETGIKSSRLESLKEFHDGYGWCAEGARVIMSAQQGNALHGLPRGSVLGLVADNLDVPRGYETAVESVLGEKLQYILVKDQTDGIKAIDYLKNYSLGRCSFVPLELRNHVSDSLSGHHLSEAVPLLDFVKTPDDFRDVARYLLGDVLLIPSLDRGIALWRQNGFRGTFVTPEGDIISPDGVLTGGSRTNGEKGLLQNKREMIDLEGELENLSNSLAERLQRKKKISSLIAQWEEEFTHLGSERQRLEIRTNGKHKDAERYEEDRRRVTQSLQLLDFERVTRQSEQQDAGVRFNKVREDLTACEQREQELNEAMTRLQTRWESFRSDLDRQEKELTGKRVLLASLEEKRTAGIKTRERLEATETQIAESLAAKTAQIEDMGHVEEEMATQVTLGQEDLVGLYKEFQALDGELAKTKTLQQDHEASLRTLEAEMREVKKTLEQIGAEATELEMTYREIRVHMENLQTNLQSRDSGDLGTLMAMFERLDEAGLQNLRMKLEKERGVAENFGEVNLLALTEFEQLKERYDFLKGQASDLNASIQGLEKTITKMNAASRKRFAETFDAVNVCFQDVFRRLFPGGKGELRLTDDTDLLETGVDIDIQVPGKRPQSITLLSGGEKSLAAIALILAIILHRPSPFIILDEVDAALDDANTVLFNQLVKDVSASSQVILVTHNKTTMEIADHLYGVTMQQHGVSTIVSVNLNAPLQ